MFTGKIFCIGFHKTGTSSLANALDYLGYRVTGSFGLMDPDIAMTVGVLATQIVPQFDAFQDNPWPLLYQEMDQAYPHSRFIFTLRPIDAWMTSVLRHFGGRSTPMRTWIYGAGDPRGNEILYRKRYEQHTDEVLAYFSERPLDLLVFNVTAGDGWEKLCAFLQIDNPPSIGFPHINSHAERSRLLNKIKYRLREFHKNKLSQRM